MPSEHEIQFHRSFLSLPLSLAIWNEDYNHQNSPGGKPPARQQKMESDPVYAYHVQQGPHWPSKHPGDPASKDRKYNAQMAHADGSLKPLEIVTKRGMAGQNFASVATSWEASNSVLCGKGKFGPVVNEMMEVTGHYANIRDSHLIHPKGIKFTDPSECISNDIPIYLWIHDMYDGRGLRAVPAPEGWEAFRQYHGGIDVLVLPNGEVIDAKGNAFSANNGHAISVMSPLDFWAPGSRLAAAAIRGLTNRVSAAVVGGFKALRAPTKELAESTVAKLAPKTLPGVAVSSRGMLPVATAGRRTIIMADDMAQFQPYLASSTAEKGFYDIVIHGDPKSFYILEKGVWKTVSVSEVANAVRPLLGPNDKIRLLACESASRGGPAQELANQLKRTVWAPSKSVYPVHGVPIKDAGGNVVRFSSAKSFVPDGGKFFQFDPAGGSAILAGPGRQVNQHVIKRTR